LTNADVVVSRSWNVPFFVKTTSSKRRSVSCEALAIVVAVKPL
jgi:hypothetical protein